jgi:hypothetical protein
VHTVKELTTSTVFRDQAVCDLNALAEASLPVVRVEPRHRRAVLKAQINKKRQLKEKTIPEMKHINQGARS